MKDLKTSIKAKISTAFSGASPEGATQMWCSAGNTEDSQIIYTYGQVHVTAGSGSHVSPAPLSVEGEFKKYADQALTLISAPVESGVDNSPDPAEALSYPDSYSGLVCGQPGCPQNGAYYNGTKHPIPGLQEKIDKCKNVKKCTQKLRSLRIGKQVLQTISWLWLWLVANWLVVLLRRTCTVVRGKSLTCLH